MSEQASDRPGLVATPGQGTDQLWVGKPASDQAAAASFQAMGAEGGGSRAAIEDVGEAAAKRKLGAGFWISTGWVVAVILAAALAGLLPISDPTTTKDLPRLGPSLHHLLGTDDLGRDMLSRIIFGARVSLIVGFASIAIGLGVGGIIGLIAGYYGGKVDALISVPINVFLAFPALILFLAVVSFVGQNLRNVVIVIGVVSIAPLARIVRGSTVSYAQRDFVLAARALGARNGRIIFREILPNVVPAALAFALVGVAVAIVAEGSLAFFGLSVPPPTPTWGGMINEGRTVLQQDAMVTLWPAAAMFLTVIALNFAGDRLRAFFDVKEGAL